MVVGGLTGTEQPLLDVHRQSLPEEGASLEIGQVVHILRHGDHAVWDDDWFWNPSCAVHWSATARPYATIPIGQWRKQKKGLLLPLVCSTINGSHLASAYVLVNGTSATFSCGNHPDKGETSKHRIEVRAFSQGCTSLRMGAATRSVSHAVAWKRLSWPSRVLRGEMKSAFKELEVSKCLDAYYGWSS